jgi:hypothetical protein
MKSSLLEQRAGSKRKAFDCLLLGFGLALALTMHQASADEGGVGVWVPGLFGSFAAVPGAPGWSLGTFYYHVSADAGASKSFSVGRSIVAGLRTRADIVFFAPTYTFPRPVLDGQAAVGVIGGAGRVDVSTNATFNGPNKTVTYNDSDARTGGTDLYGVGTLKWQRGDHNYMAYTLLGVPVGAYQDARLANVGTNHWAIDAGGAYTYFDATKGREFSVVGGLTYNFENPDTDYRNGIDGHVDWAASQFFSERLHAGIAGYFYHQLSGDSGAGATLGPFESRTNGIGPQIGYFFPVPTGKAYVSLKGFWEFDASHRAAGWNMFLSLALPLSSTVH